MNEDEQNFGSLLGSMNSSRKVYTAALIGWLAEDDAIVDQINAHLRCDQVTQEYWHQHSGEIVYSGPGEGIPPDSWSILGDL